MIYTFPHFGMASIVVEKIFRELDVPYIAPERNSMETLQKGMAVSPEEICMPFKYMAGNLIDAYEKGADTVIMVSTSGPCRLGEYSQLLVTELENGGYDYSWIFFHPIREIGVREAWTRFKRVFMAGGKKLPYATKVIIRSLNFIREYQGSMDRLMAEAGRARNPHQVVKLMKELELRTGASRDIATATRVARSIRRQAGMVARGSRRGLRILITGEIYTSMEPDLNQHLHQKLMSMGCTVVSHLSLWWWIKNAVRDVMLPEKIKKLVEQGDGLECNVGGYARQSVRAILKGDYDGVIKVMPSGCMPEIVAKGYCDGLPPEIGERILHLIYDEMQGEGGYDTRIEAFVDMLERRRDVLHGNRHRLHKHGFSHN